MTAQQLITDHLDIWTAAHKTRSTAGRGSNNKLNLHGIKKLRELILELAVRGKLVPQDANDEPASELLKKIAAEKTKLIKEGKLKKDKAIPDTRETEKPFDIPSNWQWSKLSDISIINPRNSAEDELEASFVPMTLIDSRFDGGHEQELRPWKEIKQGFTHFAEGDIGVAKITPCFENSKACVFKNLANKIGAGTTELHIVRPINNTLNSRYVLACLKSPSFLLVGETKMTGTAGQKRLPKDFLESYPFALPPLAEQHRIVAKVDELMAFCDQLEQTQSDTIAAHAQLVEALLATLTNSGDHFELQNNWQRIAAHFNTLFTTEHSIDQLKQTILQLAVMGKLVPQNPNDEPASELLKKIAAEKVQLIKEGKIKKEKTPPNPPFSKGGDQIPTLKKGVGEAGGICDLEQPFELPSGWEWCKLIFLGQDFGGGTPSKENAQYWNGDIPWVSPKDMKMDYIFEAQDLITQSALENSTVKLIPPNSLLLVVRGMILAHSFPVAINKVPVTINQDMKALVFSNVNPELLLLIMKGMKNVFVDLIDRSSHGTCKLVSEKLWNTVIALPPLTEQHRIVTKVNELMSLCDTLKTNLQNAQTTQLALADALVEQAVN